MGGGREFGKIIARIYALWNAAYMINIWWPLVRENLEIREMSGNFKNGQECQGEIRDFFKN